MPAIPDKTTLPAGSPPDSASNLSLTEIRGRAREANFWEVAEIRDRDGVVAVITEKARDGRHSFAFFREFEVDGKIRRSNYLSVQHIPSLVSILRELARHLEAMEERAKAVRLAAATGADR